MKLCKANQSILLVSRPPPFKSFMRAGGDYSLFKCHFEGVASWNGGAVSWNHPKN